jgi:hypothetical protein
LSSKEYSPSSLYCHRYYYKLALYTTRIMNNLKNATY